MKRYGMTVLFWGVFLVLLTAASYLMIPKENTLEAGMERRDVHANGIRGEPEHTLDVIILGDSESHSGISPMELWKSRGIASYVCGQSGQRAVEAYFMLKEVLKRQSPKLVILETDLFYHCRDSAAELKQVIEKTAWHYFPVFQYHDRWKSLTKDDWKGKIQVARDYKKGFIYQKTEMPYTGGAYMKKTEEREPSKPMVRFWIDRIADLCRRNQAEFLLVGIPAPANWDYKRHNEVAAYASERGVPYLDLNLMEKELQIDWSRDSLDGGDHLNSNGAVKVSRYLGAYLKEHYTLPDHREEIKYAQWNEDLKAYEEEMA